MWRKREDYNSPEYKAWRYAVFCNCNWECQMCHRRGIPIQAHHIKKWSLYPRLRYVVSNGCSLCLECHKLVTGNEEAYEAQFKKIIDLLRIAKRNKKKPKTASHNKGRSKSKKNTPKKKWKPRNINLRY